LGHGVNGVARAADYRSQRLGLGFVEPAQGAQVFFHFGGARAGGGVIQKFIEDGGEKLL